MAFFYLFKMPYKAFAENDQYCVYKLNANDEKTGKSLGCHPSLKLANEQVAALYAAEGKKMSDKVKEQSETKMYGEMKYTPAASFAELQAMEEAQEVEEMAEYFPMMVGNILNRSEIEDKNEALRQLSIEFVGIVNEKIASKEASKETVEDEETNEEKEQEKDIDDTTLFERMADWIKDKFGLKEKEQINREIFIWKDATTGKYKCILAYSNNFRDNDNPPEIITTQSHKEFDEALNKGEWPMPDLWLWHVDYPIGRVDYHAYDEKSGFCVAAATIDKEWAAEALMKSDDWDALSHGMPVAEIVRDKEDDSLIVRHRTKEISFLPRWAAANKLTFHLVSKESDMSEETKGLGDKRQHFVDFLGGNEELVQQIEAHLSDKSEEAKQNGTEQKQTTEDVPKEEQPVTRQELLEALAYVIDEVKAIKAGIAEKQAEEDEPLDLVAQLRAHSAIGREETKVDGRTKEAKDAPTETPAENRQQVEPVYGVPLLDNLVANKQAYATKQAQRFNMGNLPPEFLAAMTEANSQ